MNYLWILILLSLALLAIELRKTYHSLPRNELKFLARSGDPLASMLFRAAAYDSTLEYFLWVIIIITSSLCVVIVSRVTTIFFAAFFVGTYIYVAFAWLPNATVNSFSFKITRLVTPAVAVILNYIQPFVGYYHHKRKKTHKVPQVLHTGIYDNEGIEVFLKSQVDQQDNRIPNQVLSIMLSSLSLTNTKISKLATKWDKLKKISDIDSIGPIMLDELHKSGQQFIPVIDKSSKSKKIVGFLDMNKLTIDSQGIVSDSMDKTVYYLNEDDNLYQAFEIMMTTNYPVFVVVDEDEKYVGLVTMDKIVEKLINKVDDFNIEDYASITRAAAKYNNHEDNSL